MFLFYKSCIEQSSFNPFKPFKMPNIDVVFVQDLMLNMAAFGKEKVSSISVIVYCYKQQNSSHRATP